MADIAVLPASKAQGEQFEQMHVRKIYDEIATSVNDIEHKAWPKVKRFLKKFETGSLVADIGCGNGRYLSINKTVYKIGLDVCSALVDNSRLKGYEVSYADNLHIPLRDNLFDGVVSIGVIHHFCSIERRIKAIEELWRILKPGGKVMFYVWAYEQKHRKFDSQDVLIPWHDGSLNNKKNGSTSSRHSSIGGMSSTSSVSEDDSMDFSKEEMDVIAQSSAAISRKSSVSLDDLSALDTLSNFKPSYYSLEFTGSPARSDRLGSSVGSKDGKNAIVTECRKLEESMRALSASNLDELRTKPSCDLKVKSNTGHHLSLEDLESTKDQSDDTYLHNDENGISFMEEEMLEAEVLNYNDLNYIRSNRHETRSSHGRRKHSRERSHFVPCAKINPFLKENSFESYTFNNVTVSSDESDSLEDIMEVESENTTQDEVFVKFQPEEKGPTNTKNLVKETSFFSSLKTKLLSLFDDDDKQLDQSSKRTPSPFEKNQNRHLNTPTDTTLLTQEQLSLADKLNFRVREFPQSSCAETLNKQLYDNGYCQSSSDPWYILQCQKDSRSTHMNFQKSPDALSKESFQKLFEQGDISYLNTVNDPTKLYNLGKEKMHQYLSKNQKLQSSISVEEVIYDGFIKLDVKGVKNGETKSQEGALKSKNNAKEKQISPIHENKQVIDERGDVDQNVKHRSREVYNDTLNGCNKNEMTTKLANNSCHATNEKEDIQPISIKITQNDKLDLEKVDSEKTVDSVMSDLMNDSGISEKEETMKGKLCRYYHVFREGELESLITSHIPGLKVIQGFYDHANWCVVAEKC